MLAIARLMVVVGAAVASLDRTLVDCVGLLRGRNTNFAHAGVRSKAMVYVHEGFKCKIYMGVRLGVDLCSIAPKTAHIIQTIGRRGAG